MEEKTRQVTMTDASDVTDEVSNHAIRALIPLVITFILGTLCLQGFNLVFQQVGRDVGAIHGSAALITALPSIVLGIVCFIYGSLGDFVSLKKLVVAGLVTLLVGSLFGFFACFFFKPNLWVVIIARVLQTAGEQVAGSVYLVLATKYLKNSLKVIFFGLFTAAYQLSASIGVFAAGVLSRIHWQYLFLIPVITIFFLPILLKNLPNQNAKSEHIDILGFAIFGVATAFLTLYFSYSQWWMLLLAVVLYVVFAVYINVVKNAFIKPSFFRNTRWILGIILIAFFYFTNYCISPLFNAIGGAVYHYDTRTVSNYLVWTFILAAVSGVLSGLIVGKIGKKLAIIIASICMAVGFIGAGLLVNSGFLALTVMAAIFYAGAGLLYSPIISTVLDTLPKSESGRGVGMNDLLINVSASIGITIVGRLMGTKGVVTSFVGITGPGANFSNLLVSCGIVVIAGLILYLVFNRHIYSQNKGDESLYGKAC